MESSYLAENICKNVCVIIDENYIIIKRYHATPDTTYSTF